MLVDAKGCALGVLSGPAEWDSDDAKALIAAARQREVHAMIGGIDATNAGSIALHKRLGFRHVGTLPQVGFKFGRWLDLSFYQLLLDGPPQPVDG